MVNYITSDNHFFHVNVIQYSNRPFKDVDEMNNAMIKNWNACVSPNDTVYHLGDFMFSNDIGKIDWLLSQLNGKIFLIQGNHDKSWLKKLPKCRKDTQDKFVAIKDYHTMTTQVQGNKHYIVMMHFPILRWDRCHYGSIHFHGHSHGNLNNDGIRRYDVGVDNNMFTPIQLDHMTNFVFENNE